MNERTAQAEALLAEFGWELSHAHQVRDLALMLFDQLDSLHQLGAAARDLLAAAALLHDIGWTVGGSKHHKQSAQFIRDNAAKLPGFSPGEVELIANIARYHRKSVPSARHEAYAALPAPGQRVVEQLAALLRLADGLDRPHLQWVREIACKITDRHLVVQVSAMAETGLHIEGAVRKRGLFETVFGRPVEFAVAAGRSVAVVAAS